MIEINDKSNCCGCSACVAICPNNCIKLKKDSEGFDYPEIDENVCIKCDMCEKICPVLNKKIFKDEIRKTYGGMNVNKDIKFASSSGGVFTLLAEYIINNGGVVFGAAVSKDCYFVEHIKVDRINDLAKLRGSKYVQSDVNNCFKEVEYLLKQGKLVLFTGTPCQVAGVKTFLKRDYDNLFTQDIVCHGVPSPKVWYEYIKDMEKRYAHKAKFVNFRHKVLGDKTYSLKIEFQNGKVYCNDKNTDVYLRGYISNLFLRPSCYECMFKGLDRCADITLADFWGVEDYAPELCGEFGVSLLSVHNEKGMWLFRNIANNLEFREFDDTPIVSNVCSIKSTPKPEKRDEFLKDFDIKKMKQFDLSKKIKIKLIIKKKLKHFANLKIIRNK